MVLFFLPAQLILFDGFIQKTTLHARFYKPNETGREKTAPRNRNRPEQTTAEKGGRLI
jgi:hypothetical protein